MRFELDFTGELEFTNRKCLKAKCAIVGCSIEVRPKTEDEVEALMTLIGGGLVVKGKKNLENFVTLCPFSALLNRMNGKSTN